MGRRPEGRARALPAGTRTSVSHAFFVPLTGKSAPGGEDDGDEFPDSRVTAFWSRPSRPRGDSGRVGPATRLTVAGPCRIRTGFLGSPSLVARTLTQRFTSGEGRPEACSLRHRTGWTPPHGVIPARSSPREDEVWGPLPAPGRCGSGPRRPVASSMSPKVCQWQGPFRPRVCTGVASGRTRVGSCPVEHYWGTFPAYRKTPRFSVSPSKRTRMSSDAARVMPLFS